jgi:hypothetical protein
MTKDELIDRLIKNNTGDEEADHGNADGLLLEYINDEEIEEAYWKSSNAFWCA